MSHGSTGKGNDQVRFELCYLGMDPNLKCVTLWREPEYLAKFEGLLMGQAGKGFGEFNPKRFFGDSRQPLTFCHFLEGIGEEPVYDQIHELSVLQKILDQALGSPAEPIC